jgi:hypothetical protein
MSADQHGQYDQYIRSAMAEVTNTFAGPTSIIEEVLGGVTAAAVELIPGVDFADVLLIQDSQLQATAATSELASTLDQVQLLTRRGPCWDAASDQDCTHEADSGALNLFGFTSAAFEYESDGDRPDAGHPCRGRAHRRQLGAPV